LNDAQVSPAAIAVGTLVSIDMTPSPAQARDYPFCIKGPDFGGGIGDCSFGTYRQCAGDGLRTHKAYRGANPFFAYAEKLPRISYPAKPGRGYQDQNGPWSDPACGVTFSALPVERFRTCTLRIELQTRNPAVTNFVTSRGPAATS
jgi:hypothetical protein